MIDGAAMLRILLSLLFVLHAADTPEADRAQMREALRRYLLGTYTCNMEMALESVASEQHTMNPQARGPRLSNSIASNKSACAEKKPIFAPMVMLYGFQSMTPDSALASGNFRGPGTAIQSYGNVSVTFVRRDSKWLVFDVFRSPSLASPTNPFRVPKREENFSKPGPDGWISLFDGTSLDAFTGIGDGGLPASWQIDGDTLHLVSGMGQLSIQTKETFRSFELAFEWKAPPKGNSGVKYRIFATYVSSAGPTDALAFEYQLADDGGDPGAIANPDERSGALYNQIAPSAKVVKRVGEFNESRIVVRGRRIEHWLNRTKVVDYEAETESLDGPIVFQNHLTEFWFRNVRIKRID